MALPNMRVRVTADTADAEGGFERVERAANDTGASVTRLSRRVSQSSRRLSAATSGNRAFGRSVQNVSFQVGDFATQVGAGTNASIALGQQLPQLLGGFGILGAAIGAVVAISVPLVRVMGEMSTEGRSLTELFGAFQPLAESVAVGVRQARDALSDFAEVVVNNLDRVIAIAGVAATAFGTRLVAGFVAARVAAFSFAGALVAVRTALIRTGIGAIIVLIGEAVVQMSRLAKATGGIGAAFTLVAETMRASWQGALAFMIKQLGTFFASAALAINRSNLPLAIKEALIDPLNSLGGAMLETFNKLGGNQAIKNAADAVKRLFDEMERGREAQLDFGSLFGGGTDPEADKDAKKEVEKRRERLAEGVQAVRESLMSEREALAFHLEEKKALLQEAFENEVVTKQEQNELLRELEAEHQEKLAEMDRKRREKEINEKGADFKRIYDLTRGSLSDQLGAWGNFFNSLSSTIGSSNKKVFAAMQTFAAAEALINAFRAYNQVLADPTLPWFAKAAAAAQVLAAGLGAVNAIRSASMSGGGGGRSGGSSSGAQTQPSQPAQRVVIEATGDSFSRNTVEGIFTQINDGLRRGYRIEGVEFRAA